MATPMNANPVQVVRRPLRASMVAQVTHFTYPRWLLLGLALINLVLAIEGSIMLARLVGFTQSCALGVCALSGLRNGDQFALVWVCFLGATLLCSMLAPFLERGPTHERSVVALRLRAISDFGVLDDALGGIALVITLCAIALAVIHHGNGYVWGYITVYVVTFVDVLATKYASHWIDKSVKHTQLRAIDLSRAGPSLEVAPGGQAQELCDAILSDLDMLAKANKQSLNHSLLFPSVATSSTTAQEARLALGHDLTLLLQHHCITAVHLMFSEHELDLQRGGHRMLYHLAYHLAPAEDNATNTAAFAKLTQLPPTAWEWLRLGIVVDFAGLVGKDVAEQLPLQLDWQAAREGPYMAQEVLPLFRETWRQTDMQTTRSIAEW